MQIKQFFTADINESETCAEMLVTGFVAEHNLSVVVSNHVSKLLKTAFPDSEIGRKYVCMHTKTTAIIKETANDSVDHRAENMRCSLFSLAQDSSSGAGASKLFPIIIQHFNDSKGKVITSLLSVSTCTVCHWREYFSSSEFKYGCQESPSVKPLGF